MIKVAIQPNVKFSSVELDETGNVNIVFTQGEEVDALQALMGNGDLGGAESSKVIIWSLKGTGYQDAKLEGKEVVDHLNQYKAFFNKILTHFFTKEEMKNVWSNNFEGITIQTSKDIESLSASQIELVGKNMNKAFVEKMKEADLTKSFRIKFYRSSAAKNFISLTPLMFLNYRKETDAQGFKKFWTVPFMEDMSAVPEDSQSKLAYTKREIEKGKNDPNPVQADSSPNTGDESLPF